MNIVLFTNDQPLYLPKYIQPILEEEADSIEEIVIAPHQQSEGLIHDIEQRYQMFGPRAFITFGMIFVIRKILDTLLGERTQLVFGQYYSVSALASSYDIPIRVVDDINGEEFIKSVENKNPDLILSIACGQLMGEELLSIPTKGCVNVHGSLLPKHRGRATAFWVLYENEDRSGVTAHLMTPEFDDGGIVLQHSFDIQQGDSMHDIYTKVITIGPSVAISVIEQFRSGDITTKPNPSDEGKYRSTPTSEERDEFLQSGNSFF